MGLDLEMPQEELITEKQGLGKGLMRVWMMKWRWLKTKLLNAMNRYDPISGRRISTLLSASIIQVWNVQPWGTPGILKLCKTRYFMKNLTPNITPFFMSFFQCKYLVNNFCQIIYSVHKHPWNHSSNTIEATWPVPLLHCRTIRTPIKM